MSPAVNHGAAGPLAGYLWQIRRAFLKLLDADFDDVLQIETLDDIVVVRDGQAALAAQAKHSFGDAAITLAATEWWKTLRVWFDLSEKGLIHDDTELVLCTTAEVSTDMTVLAFLPRNDSDLIALLHRHDQISASRSNEALKGAYDAWEAASPERRRSVLSRALVEPGQPRLANCQVEIDRALRRCGIPAGAALDAIRERLIGWFQSTLEARLTTSGCEIRYDELNEQLTDLRYEMNPRALPCTHSQAPTPSLRDERQGDPTYLRQLDLLSASEDDLTLAVSMYHRATAERNQWLDGRITAIGVLKSYDADLANTWRQKRTQIERVVGQSTEQERGLKLLDACMEYRGAVNGVPAPTHVAVGTFHILANQPSDPPDVGWHPRYPELLRPKST